MFWTLGCIVVLDVCFESSCLSSRRVGRHSVQSTNSMFWTLCSIEICVVHHMLRLVQVVFEILSLILRIDHTLWSLCPSVYLVVGNCYYCLDWLLVYWSPVTISVSIFQIDLAIYIIISMMHLLLHNFGRSIMSAFWAHSQICEWLQ